MSDRGHQSRDRLQRLLIKKREQLLTHEFGDLVPESITDKCTQFIINPLDRHMLLISSIVELTNWEQVANENKLVEIFNYYANILLVDKKSKQQLIKISSEMISTIQNTWNSRFERKLSSINYIQQLQKMKLFIKTLESKNILEMPKSFKNINTKFEEYILDCSNFEEDVVDESEGDVEDECDTPKFTPPPNPLNKISEEDMNKIESKFEDFQWDIYLFASFINIIH